MSDTRNPLSEKSEPKSRNSQWLWGVLAGMIFLVIGALTGQFSVIWQKAVMICLECIGIG